MDEAENNNREALFTIKGRSLDYFRYRKQFKKAMVILGLNPDHKPHDPRKQFVTMAKRYDVDEYVIKLVVGHVISDITESIYNDRSIENLRNEIEKIKL